ncbi:membrane protein [Actinoplanes teichomyceticus]|nr:membrane protein [Actinoplanes teichomyceticus]
MAILRLFVVGNVLRLLQSDRTGGRRLPAANTSDTTGPTTQIPAPRAPEREASLAAPEPGAPESTASLAAPEPGAPGSGAPVAAARPRRLAGIAAAWPALLLYATLRATGLITFWLIATEKHRDMWAQLGRWDAGWYTGIVARGYDAAFQYRPDGTPLPSNLAFFPLYPGLTWLADRVVPGDAAVAGLAIAWTAGLAAAWGLFAVGAHLHNRRTGVLLAGLWAVIPHALVESMAYTETLFTALCAWSLFAVLRRHWVTAGLLCSLAGLTRPTGAALVTAVGLAALVAVVRRRDGWRPWLGGLLAPLGFAGYVLWVGDRLGRTDGYFRVQKDTWNMYYDNGWYTLTTARTLVTGKSDLAIVMCTVVLLAAIALFVALSADGRAWPLAVFSLVVIAMVFFGHGYYHAKGRLLIPAFPVLLPIASALAAAHRRTVVAVLTTLAVVSATYGVYVLLFWTHSP